MGEHGKMTPNARLRVMLEAGETLRSLEARTGLSKTQISRLSRVDTCYTKTANIINIAFKVWVEEQAALTDDEKRLISLLEIRITRLQGLLDDLKGVNEDLQNGNPHFSRMKK